MEFIFHYPRVSRKLGMGLVDGRGGSVWVFAVGEVGIWVLKESGM